jgi:imidazole glycerol-phosphate synthase subunit HisH
VTVAIVDIGMGNMGSVANMLRKVGADPLRTSDPAVIGQAAKVVLPGVGAFDEAMERLRAAGLVEALTKQVEAGTPVLGICLGMQLLADWSEEGVDRGLGWIPGSVRRLPGEVDGESLAVPHMGWNTLDVARSDPLLDDLAPGARYYFVHSYAFQPDDADHVTARSSYGTPFVSAVRNDNVVGVQFHPEKSHQYGMELMRRFAEL